MRIVVVTIFTLMAAAQAPSSVPPHTSAKPT